MEQYDTAAIDLKVEIALEHIVTRREEKLNTAVPTDTILMLCGYCANIPVFDPEHHVYRHVVVGDLHLRPGEMVGLLSHVVPEQFGGDILPWGVVPSCTSLRSACQSFYGRIHGMFFASPFSPLEIGNHTACCVVPGGTGHPAAGMATRAA